MSDDRLLVLHGKQLVGCLGKHEGGRLEFQYAKEWLGSRDGFAISQSLPLSEKVYADEKPRRYFANLLPEGQIRQLLARRLGLSADNDFALLRAIGKECAGALSVCPEDELDDPEAASCRRMTVSELERLAGSPPVYVALVGTGKVRLSMAGAQDKLPVCVEQGEISLPEGGAPSSHILKFGSRDFSHLPANEVLTTMLARAMDLKVVDLELKRFGRHTACLVTRYDRRREDDGSLQRIHQEDFCQALGLDHTTKYQAEGGPSYADCHDLVARVSSEPLVDTEQLLKWQVFCVMAGNSDGHAKNLSLLHTGRGKVRLAPFYDLVCTHAYKLLERGTAMRVGQAPDPGHVRGRDWATLALGAGVGKKFLLDLVKQAAERLPDVAGDAVKSFQSRYGDSPVVQMMLPGIKSRARRILRILSE